MATNSIHRPGHRLSVVCTHPTTPDSGQPCRLADHTGVALITEGDSISGETTVDFGPGVWDLPVDARNDAGDVAVAIGDDLYYVDADIDDGTGFLSKKASGRYFGWALEAVTSGELSTIKVAHDPATVGNQTATDLLRLGAHEVVTIATGVATITKSNVWLAAESSTSDQLDTLTLAGAADGDVVFLRSDTGDTITVDDANIDLGAATRAIAPGGCLALIFDGTSWAELFFITAADNA